MTSLDDVPYPVTIVKDRYGGGYSGGSFLAFNMEFGEIPWIVGADDVSEREGWLRLDKRIKYGRGNTPNEALEDLGKRLKSLE